MYSPWMESHKCFFIQKGFITHMPLDLSGTTRCQMFQVWEPVHKKERAGEEGKDIADASMFFGMIWVIVTYRSEKEQHRDVLVLLQSICMYLYFFLLQILYHTNKQKMAGNFLIIEVSM